MTELEDFENWLYDKHCCIIIRRGSLFGECISCKVQSMIDGFKEDLKEKKIETK